MYSLLRRLLRGFSGVDTFADFLQRLSHVPSIRAIGIYGQMYCVLQPSGQYGKKLLDLSTTIIGLFSLVGDKEDCLGGGGG